VNDTDKFIIGKFRSLLVERVRVYKIILFGSRARGDAHTESDMDLLVILHDPPTEANEDYIIDCAWEAGIDHSVVIVPIVYSREEWEEGPEQSSLLALAVQREGLSVYESRAR
jgi:uncharacterized protein